MNRWSLLVLSTGAALCSTLSGCAQSGANLPSMGRVFDIAKQNAKEPATWIPFTAAAAIGITGSDNSISEWISDNTPIFGSQNSASDASDDIKNALLLGAAVSSIAAPTPAEDATFLTRRIVGNVLAISTMTGIVEVGKQTVKRDRPNNRNDKSFPSGHSSTAFSSAYLLQQNFNAADKKPWLRNTINLGTSGAAAAVAWARVEAEEHHAIDVLFSAALSNLVVKTFYQAIVTEGGSAAPPIAVEASRKGFSVTLSHSF